MSSIKSEIEIANAAYADDFDKGDLALPPARGFLILTCMDARLDPAKYAGLAEGDAHVVRNAGGRATDDAIRSMVISHKLLGTREWFVIHHTDCGMLYFDDSTMGDLLAGSLETAELTGARLPEPLRTRRLDRGPLRQMAHDPGSGGLGGRGRHPHPPPPARQPGDPGLLLLLRGEERPSERSGRRHRGRPSRRLIASAPSGHGFRSSPSP